MTTTWRQRRAAELREKALAARRRGDQKAAEEHLRMLPRKRAAILREEWRTEP